MQVSCNCVLTASIRRFMKVLTKKFVSSEFGVRYKLGIPIAYREMPPSVNLFKESVYANSELACTTLVLVQHAALNPVPLAT